MTPWPALFMLTGIHLAIWVQVTPGNQLWQAAASGMFVSLSILITATPRDK